MKTFSSLISAMALVLVSHAEAYSHASGKVLDLDNSSKPQNLSEISVVEDIVYSNNKADQSVKYIEAKIQELDIENRKVTFVDTETGETQTYAYDPEAAKAKRSRDIDVSRIKPGQKVVLQVVTR